MRDEGENERQPASSASVAVAAVASEPNFQDGRRSNTAHLFFTFSEIEREREVP